MLRIESNVSGQDVFSRTSSARDPNDSADASQFASAAPKKTPPPGLNRSKSWARKGAERAYTRSKSVKELKDEFGSVGKSLAGNTNTLFSINMFKKKKDLDQIANDERLREEELDAEGLVGNETTGRIHIIDGQEVKADDYEVDFIDEEGNKHFRRKEGWCGCCEKTDPDNVPNVPEYNLFRCRTDNKFRRTLMLLAVNRWLERLFLANSIAHNVELLMEKHDDAYKMPFFVGVIHVSVYFVELCLKSWAFGLWGGRYAYINYDIFNRMDFVVTCFGPLELIAEAFGTPFTLRAFRMFRVLKPLMKMEIFADMELIMRTLEVGAVAQGTVVYLMLFVFVLFGVAGFKSKSLNSSSARHQMHLNSTKS